MTQEKPLWKKTPKHIIYICKECLSKGRKIQFEVINAYHAYHIGAFKLQCPLCHRKSHFLDVKEIKI